MAFTVPRFSEVGESEFIENLMTVVHRDMLLALDYFYPADNLDDFALMTDGDVSEFRYPLLVLGVERMISEETEGGSYLNQDLTIGAGIVVLDTSLKLARIKARKYVRAFKAVIRSADPEDLLPPNEDVLNCVIDIEHRYLRHGTKDTNVTQPVEIAIKIKFGEE